MGEEQGVIIFGDGLQAFYYDETHAYTDRYGKKVKKILVVPGANLRKRYNLTDEKLPVINDDGRHGIWNEYPVDYMYWRGRGRFSAVLDIACAFDGAETPTMNRYEGLLETINSLHKKIDMLLTRIGVLELELSDLYTQPPEHLKKLMDMADVVKERRYEDEDNDGGD